MFTKRPKTAKTSQIAVCQKYKNLSSLEKMALCLTLKTKTGQYNRRSPKQTKRNLSLTLHIRLKSGCFSSFLLSWTYLISEQTLLYTVAAKPWGNYALVATILLMRPIHGGVGSHAEWRLRKTTPLIHFPSPFPRGTHLLTSFVKSNGAFLPGWLR